MHKNNQFLLVKSPQLLSLISNRIQLNLSLLKLQANNNNHPLLCILQLHNSNHPLHKPSPPNNKSSPVLVVHQTNFYREHHNLLFKNHHNNYNSQQELLLNSNHMSPLSPIPSQ